MPAIETLALFAGCLAFAEFMTGITKDTVIQLPTFVLGTGGCCGDSQRPGLHLWLQGV